MVSTAFSVKGLSRQLISFVRHGSISRVGRFIMVLLENIFRFNIFISDFRPCLRDFFLRALGNAFRAYFYVFF